MSLDASDESENISSSQSSSTVQRQSSSSSSYFDSQDSATAAEVSTRKRKRVTKDCSIPECNQRVAIVPGQ